MVIYGGVGGCSSNMQILPNANANWTLGPSLYKNRSSAYHSGYQVFALFHPTNIFVIVTW
jgi:hypothetical protein